jgi:hypothetical protein
MIANLMQMWEDLAIIAACVLLVIALPFKHHRFTPKVQSTETERKQHDHD